MRPIALLLAALLAGCAAPLTFEQADRTESGGLCRMYAQPFASEGDRSQALGALQRRGDWPACQAYLAGLAGIARRGAQPPAMPPPMLAPPSPAAPLGPVSNAFWTGRSALTQTITGEQAWRCEYNYNGSMFVRLFLAGCPQGITVR